MKKLQDIEDKLPSREDLLGESQKVAVIIEPILSLVDIALSFQSEDIISMMKSCQTRMRQSTSTLEALPFPGTQNKAHEQRIKDKLFATILKLFEARKEAIEELSKGKPFVDDDALRQLGII